MVQTNFDGKEAMTLENDGNTSVVSDALARDVGHR